MKSLSYAAMSSVCALVIGILLVIWPEAAIIYLVITVGVLFLLPGLMGLFSYAFSRRRNAEVQRTFPIIALGSTLLGFWLMIMPEFFVNILMYLLGVLLVLGSLSQLINFISVRQVVKVPVFLYLISVLILAAGIVILFNPFTAATVPFIILGVSSIIYALNDLVRLLFYYHKRNKYYRCKNYRGIVGLSNYSMFRYCLGDIPVYRLKYFPKKEMSGKLSE